MKALLMLCALLVTINGPATAADSTDLERNKALVKQFFAAVEGRDKATVLKIVREDYIQHMPSIPTGRAAILTTSTELRRAVRARCRSLRA